MDVQQDTPQALSALEQATEADVAGHSEQIENSDQIPGGRYHIVERLSTSALGAVYKALDTVLDRPVAVKCLRLDTPLADQGPDELRERFVREARIAARLQHPNIVTIHDIVATPTRGYIIMEFIEGCTLESLIESEGRLPLSTAINILSQLSSALDYAHERNVVHRDVKPANILMSPSMYAWVTDFGIAKSELSTNLTMAGGVLGAPDYMSPEQAKGEDVDARSDLFSLGCILFEAVVGEKPFRSPSLTGVLLSIINDEPVFPLNWKSLGLPVELKPILHHSLEKAREKRYASGAEMMVALEAISKDAVSACDVAAGLSPASAETDNTDEAKAKSVEETTAETKSEDSPEETKLEGTSEEITPAEHDEVAKEESAPNAESDAPEAEAKSEEPEAELKTEEPADAETEPEKPAASDEEIHSLKEESQVLHLSPTLSGDLHGVEISPEEGFLLSRIDGASRPNDIISVSPMADADTARALMDLLGKGLIRLGGVTRKPVAGTPEPPPAKPQPRAKPRPGPDENTVSEVDRLLALAESEDYPALLGVSPDATEGKRKSAYLKIVAKFHPDKFANADESFREKLSRLCASASEAVDDFEKNVAAKKERETDASSPTNGQTAPSNGGDTAAPFDKRLHGRELYDRALNAYDRADYWEAIQLGRRAVAAEQHVAEFYGLLGRALLQNKKWRKEAAQNLLKATELEPNNVEFLGMLGAIYESEGLTTRATSLFEKARSIDPEYEFPNLDGPEVTVD